MSRVGSQPNSALERMLSSPRAGKYFSAAHGDRGRALDLYLWSTELSGALHAQLSFVELAVRNAIDVQLRVWNSAQQPGAVGWTLKGAAQGDLYSLLDNELHQARKNATKEVARRDPRHPRHAQPVDHDDVVAQLMFGAWVKLLRPFDNADPDQAQKDLWASALHRAFPRSGSGDGERVRLGNDLNALRFLRNRVAHHDNVLDVRVSARLNQSLSVLARIDNDFPSLAMARSPIRRLVRDDPRRGW